MTDDLDLPDLLGRDTPHPSTAAGVFAASPVSTRQAAVPRPGADDDPLEGTRFARVRIPPAVTGFGFGEVLHLLARQPAPEARRSAEVMGFDESLDASQVTAAGVSSLLSRGLMAVDAQGHSHSAGEAALLETLFATAYRWTVFTFRMEDRADLLVMIEAEGQVALLQARQYGTWFVALPGDGDPSLLASAAMSEMTDLYAGGAFAVQVRTLDRDGQVRYVSGGGNADADDSSWLVTPSLESDHVLMRGTVAEVVRWVLSTDDHSGSQASQPGGKA